ncbi:MAG: ACT domain-containing protein [Acidimicrobiia bacterium]|nr:ACT domain-containing protein [Acidimicrobiia bacterium]
MAKLVLTAIGDDHAGLVRALSGVIADHGGNWETSRMAHLAGKFAGIVLVTVPDGDADALINDLQPLQEQGLLDITAEISAPAAPSRGTSLTLELVGLDQPGIVREVSDALAARDINIEELQTETVETPMEGGTLFRARASLVLPEALSVDELTDELEELAVQLMVDIEIDEAG